MESAWIERRLLFPTQKGNKRRPHASGYFCEQRASFCESLFFTLFRRSSLEISLIYKYFTFFICKNRYKLSDICVTLQTSTRVKYHAKIKVDGKQAVILFSARLSSWINTRNRDPLCLIGNIGPFHASGRIRNIYFTFTQNQTNISVRARGRWWTHGNLIFHTPNKSVRTT